MTNASLRELIKMTVEDLVASFLWEDRKEDEDLKRGVIEDAITEGVVTVDEIVAWFRVELERR